MAQSFKRLGAIYPTANTQTNVYVVPAATEAVVSTITVCNQTSLNASFSIALMTASEYAAPAPNQSYVIRGGVVPPADTIVLTMGLTANAASIFAANTNTTGLSFIMFGSEVS
jgi:hypothetical protein